MKNIALILLVTVGLILQSCENNNKEVISTDVVKNTKSAIAVGEKGTAPKMKFDETVHDFGNMIQGERVIFAFKFANIGGSDLVITRVSSSCGCTVGSYPTEPIAPGDEGVIEVAFDSHNRKGVQNKSVTVLANTEPNSTTLRIKAKVILPERN
ncbi:MAG: DUF1573 domain-containing protein [Bacteroidetes bacterium]|nr:DUF1573 domain-containing protein [Bacteroidota bacterium]MBL6943654.1 DUF1573 domain-containing protein [Bacteroidales bacterium]